jgi:trans-aconitate 2-methyltransferase
MHYLFGDTDIAAQRLRVLADVFAEPSRAFLREMTVEKPGLALDLGCGPGFSTHLLAESLQCDHAAGLDNSQHFIGLAQETGTEQVSLYLHDVTCVPFPVRPCDLLYCRLLLTHLQQPRGILEKWVTQLPSKGLLLMEEVEGIETKHPVFTAYLEIIEALLEHQSNDLYVGRLLHNLKDTRTLKRRMSEVRRVQVATDRAAAMFFLNMQTWKDHPFIQRNYSAGLMQELEKELDTLRRKPGSTSEIEWGMRQIVFARV